MRSRVCATSDCRGKSGAAGVPAGELDRRPKALAGSGLMSFSSTAWEMGWLDIHEPPRR